VVVSKDISLDHASDSSDLQSTAADVDASVPDREADQCAAGTDDEERAVDGGAGVAVEDRDLRPIRAPQRNVLPVEPQRDRVDPRRDEDRVTRCGEIDQSLERKKLRATTVATSPTITVHA
jgi:hypothetical protein